MKHLALLLLIVCGCGEVPNSDNPGSNKKTAPSGKSPDQKSSAATKTDTSKKPESTSQVSQLQLKTHVRMTRVQAKNIQLACQVYQLDLGQKPESVSDLIQRPTNGPAEKWNGPYLASEKAPVDAWKNEFRLESTDDNKAVICSSGPDQKFGTEDDIVVK